MKKSDILLSDHIAWLIVSLILRCTFSLFSKNRTRLQICGLLDFRKLLFKFLESKLERKHLEKNVVNHQVIHLMFKKKLRRFTEFIISFVIDFRVHWRGGGTLLTVISETCLALNRVYFLRPRNLFDRTNFEIKNVFTAVLKFLISYSSKIHLDLFA